MISSRSRAGAFLGSLEAGGLGWGWFEAGWVRFTRLEIPVDGLPPRRARPWELADPEAELRVLLCHFPSVLDSLPPAAFQLVLAGHMHDGQISVPLPGGKLRLASPRARYTTGLYERGGTWMHISPGLGTTFVPFRFY